MDAILPVLLFVAIAAAVSVGLVVFAELVGPRRSGAGVDAAVAEGLVSSRGLVFAGAMAFTAMVVVGFAYDWRKGVFRWR